MRPNGSHVVFTLVCVCAFLCYTVTKADYDAVIKKNS